jgi:hypothetical protein
MRRYLVFGLALGTAAAVLVAGALAVTNVNHSTTFGQFNPNTIPAGTFKPGSLHVTDTTVYANNGGTPMNPTKEPDPTTHVNQFFDNSARITVNGGLPKCTVAQLQNTTTAQAESACGPSSGNNAELTLNADGTVNHGSAVACVAAGTGTPCAAVANGVIAAFNGPMVSQGSGNCNTPPNGLTRCPTVLLHTRVGAPLGVTLVIQGTVNKTTLGDFGYKLIVPVPQLASGQSALTYFDLTVRRKWTFNGKTYNYLKATCDNPPWHYRADFTYASGATETATRSQTCTAS